MRLKQSKGKVRTILILKKVGVHNHKYSSQTRFLLDLGTLSSIIILTSDS